jgi:glycosyltransferase involved in cell wall biosynthesis
MDLVERRWCSAVAVNVAVSPQDRDLLGRIAPAARVAVAPNGVDPDEFTSDGQPGSGIVYVGGTTPFPNRDALQFFCTQVLPHVRSIAPDVGVRWIGRASVDEQQHYRDRFGVELTGYVDDVRPFMRAGACHIVPLRTGGGTRLKILNSWAMGKPVVATSVGCEGLEAIDGDNILVRDDPKDFAAAVWAVLEHADLRQRLGKGGRNTVARSYSWDVLGRDLIDTYVTAADAGSRNFTASVGFRGQPGYGHS